MENCTFWKINQHLLCETVEHTLSNCLGLTSLNQFSVDSLAVLITSGSSNILGTLPHCLFSINKCCQSVWSKCHKGQCPAVFAKKEMPKKNILTFLLLSFMTCFLKCVPIKYWTETKYIYKLYDAKCLT